MRILAIDYGLKKIGLAFADTDLAEPLSVIKKSSLSAKKINDLCLRLEIERLVIGLPEGKLVAEIKRFAGELSLIIKLPIVFQDETLTSSLAIDKMISAGRGRKYRQQKEDAVAAAIILQNYLDTSL